MLSGKLSLQVLEHMSQPVRAKTVLLDVGDSNVVEGTDSYEDVRVELLASGHNLVWEL